VNDLNVKHGGQGAGKKENLNRKKGGGGGDIRNRCVCCERNYIPSHLNRLKRGSSLPGGIEKEGGGGSAFEERGEVF